MTIDVSQHFEVWIHDILHSTSAGTVNSEGESSACLDSAFSLQCANTPAIFIWATKQLTCIWLMLDACVSG